MEPLPQFFFGLWQVTAVWEWPVNIDMPTRILVLNDTSRSAGRWQIGNHQDLNFPNLDGESWSLWVEEIPWLGSLDDARRLQLDRVSEYVPGSGLVVTLSGILGLTIRCTSLDPLLSPPEEPVPFDFSVPES